MKLKAVLFLQGLALVMHKNDEGPAVLEMLNKALDIAQREKRVTEERNIKILIAQMHVVKVMCNQSLLLKICKFVNLSTGRRRGGEGGAWMSKPWRLYIFLWC
jgi:hypothetical protein